MTQYPAWKTITLLVVTLIGALFALPNVFGDQPAVQIAAVSGDPLPPSFGDRVGKILADAKLQPERSRLEKGQWVVRFQGQDQQLAAADVLRATLRPSAGGADEYTVALNLASKTPNWLLALGARPMALGLDLRGGVHFLLEVVLGDVRQNALKRYLNDVPALLRTKDIHYSGRRIAGDVVELAFSSAALRDQAGSAISREYPELQVASLESVSGPALDLKPNDVEAKRLVDQAVQQNLITLRNRVNQLGVAEPLVQRQGIDRIVVELPGVQDTTHVKELLGATATLEYRAVDQENNAQQAAATQLVPPDDDLYYTRDGHQPVLLKKDVIASGAELVDAAAGFDENSQPDVSVTLDSNGARRMFEFTQKNVGKPMAVLYKETLITTNRNAQGEDLRERRDIAEVISVANIRGVFGKRFQTTGLGNKEAHDLALLLKAGALAAPIDIVEERTIGPSLGADNIHRGITAAVIAFALVVTFMVMYYSLFGLFADFALLLNVILIVGGLSLLHATLTMPGIAGIVLTLGMAVDANVLINERIREELRGGSTPFAAMQAGYERAFLTIADSNVTIFIGAVVLFALGAGPVKGFAITLAMGIATSMFTAIVGTRTLAYYTLRGRRLKDLPV